MKNLLPHFILENYKNNLFHGVIEAFTMFIDISGFTPMTEKLMKGENEGAEILSEILKNIFKPTVKQVYGFGGFIINFAGDAFTSVFPVDGNEKSPNVLAKEVLICADSIIKMFENSDIQKSNYGRFKLKVKVGLSFGKVEWAIIGENHKSFYFRGEAIEGCAEAEMKARENELIIDQKFFNKISNNKVISEKRGNHYLANNVFKNDTVPLVRNFNGDISGLAKEIFSKNFFPESILNVKETGEFRNAVSVFISFDGKMEKEFIDSLFRIVINSVNHYNGYLKDIDFGDKGGVIVCYFGVPVSFEEDINFALSFMKFTKRKISSDPDLKMIRIKAGITYGKVFSGYIGGDEREQYSVLGDVVNLSARIMSKAGSDEVWINDEVFERAKNKNEFLYLGNLQFKGFSKEIPVYKLIEKDSKDTLKIKKEVVTAQPKYEESLIGREEELTILNESVKKIFNKKTSGIIYILGEAGIGKSKLIKEFRRKFSDSNKITWLYCYTSEILKRPLSPFKYLLKHFFKQSETNSAEENNRIFGNIIDIIIKRLEIISIENKNDGSQIFQIKKELERTRSILAAMIDIHWENSLYEQLDPELRFENTLFAFCNLVMAESTIQPVVIEIEDIHWLDKDSVEVLKMLLANVAGLPLAIICTSRHLSPVKKILTGHESENFKIELNYFSLTHIKDFAEKILSGKVDEKSVDFIYNNTNGNPYFVEQLILYLKDRNIWKKKNNTFTLSDYENLNIPSSISSVLISRFDRLPDKVKEVVQTASVLGREFESRILQHMLSGDKDLNSKLKLAEEENIWFVTEENKYIFTHALLREAVYSMQMMTYLRSTHLNAAATYRKFAGKKASQSIEEHIAYHFGIGHNIINSKNELISGSMNYRNEEDIKVAEEFVKMQIAIADKYYKDYRNEKAIEIYDLAVKVLDKLKNEEQEFFMLLKKANILNWISRWKEAEDAVEKANEIADKLCDRNKKMLVNRYLAEVCFYKNEFEKSLKMFKVSLDYSKSKKIISEIIDITYSMGYVNSIIGNYKRAWKYYHENSQMAGRYGNKFQVADSLASIAGMFAKTGDESKALLYSKKAFSISKKINFKRNEATLMRLFGNNFYSKGEHKKALSCYENSVRLFEELGNRSGLAQILENIGNIYFVRSDFEKAKLYYDRQFEIVKSINDNLGLASAYGCMGRLSAVVNDYKKALKYNIEQYKLNKKLKRKDALGASLGNIGKIYYDIGQYSKAINNWSKQYKISTSISKLNGIYSSLINLGTAYLVKQWYDKSRFFYDKAIKLTNNKFLNTDTFALLSNYTELLTKIKKFDEALIMCNKILAKEKLCSDNEMIILSKIVKEKILIYILSNRIINKPSLEKKLKKNIYKNISKIEMFIEDLSQKEYIADAHYNLVEILFSIKSLEMTHPKEKDYRKNAIRLYKELLSSFPINIYKIQLRNILKNKF